MNYLAHLFLAEPTPEALIGNLLGDFRTGISLDCYPIAIRRGIETHLQIDAFTDGHGVVKASKQYFSPPLRRFAGIILDILYDHYLAKHWQNYSSISLMEFSHYVYQVLDSHRELLPIKLKNALPDMIANNWLCCYRELTGLEYTLERTARRFKRSNPVAQGYAEILEHYDVLEQGFQQFFPELVAYVNNDLRPHCLQNC
jgi:acyl carrier protein phosphodiesterase